MKKGEKIVNAAEGLRLGKWLIFFLTLESGPWRRRVVCVAAARGGGEVWRMLSESQGRDVKSGDQQEKVGLLGKKGRNQETLRD